MPLTGWRDQRDWPDPQAHWSRAGRAWLLRCAACAREVIMLWYLRRRRNGFERQLGTTAARYGNATWSARPFKRASLRKANSQTARSMDIGVPSATQVERCRAKVPRHRREGNKMRSVPQHRLSEQSHAANDKAGNEGNSG